MVQLKWQYDTRALAQLIKQCLDALRDHGPQSQMSFRLALSGCIACLPGNDVKFLSLWTCNSKHLRCQTWQRSAAKFYGWCWRLSSLAFYYTQGFNLLAKPNLWDEVQLLTIMIAVLKVSLPDFVCAISQNSPECSLTTPTGQIPRQESAFRSS